MGFGIPVDEWLFADQKKNSQIKELLLSRDSRIAQWLDGKAVQQILCSQRGYPTWNLLILEEWLRQNRF